MKTKLYIHILLPVIIAGIVIGCSSASKDKSAQLEALKVDQAKIASQILGLEAEIAKENPDAFTVKAKDVGFSELSPRSFDHYVKTQGKVEAEDNIDVSAKSMGVVTKVYVQEGDNVKVGQVLAQIDNAVIVRNIEELKSQLQLTNTIYERQKNLWDQNIGTEVQFLQAKNNKESFEKRLASLVEQNEMTRIKSPISGVVDEVFAKAGQNVAPGMPTVRVVNLSDLKIKAEISEAYVTSIHEGDKVMVSIPDLDNKEIAAKVSFIGKTISQLSRTFTVEIKLPSNARLRPNMTAVVKVIFHTSPNALVVPINIVQEVNGQKIVYVAEQDGKQMVARKRVITVNGVFGSLAQVEGLKTGDKLITVGYQGLNDGEFIKI